MFADMDVNYLLAYQKQDGTWDVLKIYEHNWRMLQEATSDPDSINDDVIDDIILHEDDVIGVDLIDKDDAEIVCRDYADNNIPTIYMFIDWSMADIQTVGLD